MIITLLNYYCDFLSLDNTNIIYIYFIITSILQLL